MILVENPRTELLIGDSLEILKTFPDESVNTCITSPPYYGLRDYGTAEWEGGDAACDHIEKFTKHSGQRADGDQSSRVFLAKEVCSKCGAKRIDRQVGLEETPEEYVQKLVEVFREVYRVLKKDGTLWLNLGDSYSSQGGSQVEQSIRGNKNSVNSGQLESRGSGTSRNVVAGLKPKDLIGIPWAVAKALRDPYYAGNITQEKDRAWMAAMIDGEGTICGFVHKRKDDGRTRTGININITNSSICLLDESYRIWPTSRREPNHHGKGHLGSLPTMRWIVHGTENKILFLREIYPYLIAKKRQGLLAYNLLVLQQKAKHYGKTPQKDSVSNKRALICELISKCNKQIPVDIPDWCIEPPSLYEQGFYLRQDIIWSKGNPMPASVKDRCTTSHEYLFLLSKSPKYYFDNKAIQEFASGYDGRKDTMMKGSEKYKVPVVPGQPEHTMASRGHERWKFDDSGIPVRNKRSVWKVNTKPYPGAHFATFPEELITDCVRAGCPRGGVVLDPFVGSGTTLYVSRVLGRKSIGIDLNPGSEYLVDCRLKGQTPVKKDCSDSMQLTFFSGEEG